MREKLAFYLILEIFMSFSLFMRVSHSAQLILWYRNMRLYKQKEMHAKIQSKILLYILKNIYL